MKKTPACGGEDYAVGKHSMMALMATQDCVRQVGLAKMAWPL
jgi:hypothetical protein